MTGANPAAAEPRPVTTIDLWKVAALAIILVDHVGFFLLPDQPWLAAVGRAALPVFFFLIGFARTRSVPWFWWAAGAGLTLLDMWRVGFADGLWREVDLNIMINFALIRLALPFIEAHAFGDWRRVALLAAAFAALIPVASPWIEYGTEGWLLALVGLAHRRALEAGPDMPRDPAWLTRRALAAFATLAFIAAQIAAYGFAVMESWIMAACVITASALLLRFRAGPARWQPGGRAAQALGFCGRRSLQVYIAQIVTLTLTGMALGIDAADVNDDDNEEGEE